MKRILFLLVVLGLSSPFYSFDQVEKSNQAIRYHFESFLACAEFQSNILPKETFDSLIALPLCAKDSNKNLFPIQSFDITYAERGLYQDSTGLPIIFTDYTNDRFTGNQITPYWVSLFKERSFKGDTIYIDNIKVLGPSNKSMVCKGMKWVIR